MLTLTSSINVFKYDNTFLILFSSLLSSIVSVKGNPFGTSYLISSVVINFSAFWPVTIFFIGDNVKSYLEKKLFAGHGSFSSNFV